MNADQVNNLKYNLESIRDLFLDDILILFRECVSLSIKSDLQGSKLEKFEEKYDKRFGGHIHESVDSNDKSELEQYFSSEYYDIYEDVIGLQQTIFPSIFSSMFAIYERSIYELIKLSCLNNPSVEENFLNKFIEYDNQRIKDGNKSIRDSNYEQSSPKDKFKIRMRHIQSVLNMFNSPPESIRYLFSIPKENFYDSFDATYLSGSRYNNLIIFDAKEKRNLLVHRGTTIDEKYLFNLKRHCQASKINYKEYLIHMCEREDIRFNNAYSLQEISIKIQNDQLGPEDLLGQNFGFNLSSFHKLLQSLTFNFLNIFDYSYIYKNDKNSEIENSMRIFHHHGSRLMDLEMDLDPNQSLIHSISDTIKDAASKVFVSRFFKLFHENNPSINLNIFLENSKKVVDIPEIYNSILDQFPFDMIMKFLLTRTGVKFNNDFLQHDTDYIIENIEDFYVDKGDMIYVSKDIIRDEIISEKIIIRTQMITGNYIISKLDLSQIPNQEYEGRVYIKIVKSNEFYSYKEKVIILIYLGFYEEASKMILNGKDENYFTPDELRDHNFEVFRQNQSSFPDLIIKMFPKL